MTEGKKKKAVLWLGSPRKKNSGMKIKGTVYCNAEEAGAAANQVMS